MRWHVTIPFQYKIRNQATFLSSYRHCLEEFRNECCPCDGLSLHLSGFIIVKDQYNSHKSSKTSMNIHDQCISLLPLTQVMKLIYIYRIFQIICLAIWRGDIFYTNTTRLTVIFLKHPDHNLIWGGLPFTRIHINTLSKVKTKNHILVWQSNLSGSDDNYSIFMSPVYSAGS
jgi:hypothetical protein